MFSVATIQSTLYSWVVSQVTPLPVIWLNPNAPRPADEYVGINMTNFTANGFDWMTPPDDDGLASLYGNREFSFEINYYGNKDAAGLAGLDVIEKIQTSLQEIGVQTDLITGGVIFVDRLTLANTTELLDTRFQERIILELRFRVSNQGVTPPSTFNVGLIESVEIEGTLINESNESINVDMLVDIN